MTPVASRSVRLLTVDHSPSARERLARLFNDAPDIDVVAEAGTLEKALRLLEEASPTAVLMDCDLPKPGSLAAVKEIMYLYPVPIIMLQKQGTEPIPDIEAQALETGAVALTTWSPNSGSNADLVRTVRAMSEVRVVRRRDQRTRAELRLAETPPPSAPAVAQSSRGETDSTAETEPTPLRLPPVGERIELVAIGASTGGPPVLQAMLGRLGRRLTVPMVLVQHLSRGFQGSLVTWLTDSTGARIVVGAHGMPLEPGLIYLAPDDRHMTVDAKGHLMLNDDPAENGSRPSVSVLFRSVAQHYGPHAIGVLLTGMGRDGAKELRLMRDHGAVTIAQDEETSVVHGMPGEAIKLKGARYILPPDRICLVVEHHLTGGEARARQQGAMPITAG